jgi:hypothetical protein
MIACGWQRWTPVQKPTRKSWLLPLGGITGELIGKPAPWIVIAIRLVRSALRIPSLVAAGHT